MHCQWKGIQVGATNHLQLTSGKKKYLPLASRMYPGGLPKCTVECGQEIQPLWKHAGVFHVKGLLGEKATCLTRCCGSHQEGSVPEITPRVSENKGPDEPSTLWLARGHRPDTGRLAGLEVSKPTDGMGQGERNLHGTLAPGALL